MMSQTLVRAPFVGRGEELALLRESFARACDDARTQFVTVEGEAGIGKSRLVEEFLSGVLQQADVCTGQCSEQIRSPYLPLATTFSRVHAGAENVAPPQHKRGSAEAKAAFFEETSRALKRSGRRKPLTIVVEDLQWADSASLELLTFVLQHVPDARLLCIVSLRNEGVSADAALAAFRLQAMRRRIPAIALRAMRRNDIRRLILTQLGGTEAVADRFDAVAQIESLCEGNPLFAEELAHSARESGRLDLAAHAPLSLQAMLAERLTPLSREQRDVLMRAAIVGRRFDADFLARVAELPPARVLDALQRALEAGLLVASTASPTAFSFRHAMLRQALADRLILGLAAPLHVRIAQELENEGANSHAAALAYHWSAARIADKARFWNERAAEAAWNVYAYRDAIGFLTTALHWNYPAGPQRAALYERIGTLLYIEGCGEEPTVWFERSRAEYAAAGDAAGEAHALLRLADQYWVDARTLDSLAAATRASRTLRRLRRPVLLAEALLSLARFAVTAGDVASAKQHLAEAGTIAEHFDDGERANYHEISAETAAAAGDAPAALAHCREASRLAAKIGVSETIAQIENNCALVAADVGELDLAVRRHEIALAESRRTSMPWRVAYCALNFAGTLTLRGELRRARRLVLEALQSGVSTATFKTKAAAIGIPLALALNDRPLLDACADEAATAFAQRSGEPQRIASVAAAFAELRAAQGAMHEAAGLLNAAATAIGRPHRCAGLLLQIAVSGDAPQLAWARAAFERWQARPRIKRACRLLFEACALDAAEPRRPRLAGSAARAFSRLGWRLHEARALELGGRRDEALQRYAALDDVRDCERLRAPQTSKPSLSARQLDVARLVAAGETNRSIAAQLQISEHTVEHHVSAIFSRLGLRSRAALAAHVGRAGTA